VVDPGPVVAVTLREIYDAVVRLTGRVDVLIEQQTATAHDVQDHESRLRSLERARWPLPSIAVLTSIAAVVLAVLGLGG
jgi:hypothetical protein